MGHSTYLEGTSETNNQTSPEHLVSTNSESLNHGTSDDNRDPDQDTAPSTEPITYQWSGKVANQSSERVCGGDEAKLVAIWVVDRLNEARVGQ